MIKEEGLRKIIQKHFIVYLKLVFIFFVCIFLSIFLFLKFSDYGIIYLTLLLVWQFIFLYFYTELLIIEFDKIYIVDKEIILLTPVSFLKREIKKLNLSQIKEVKAIKKGIFGKYFDYGNLILLFGNENKIEIKNVGNISQTSKKLFEIIKNI